MRVTRVWIDRWGFARLKSRARIETFESERRGSHLPVSPGSKAGRGLKQVEQLRAQQIQIPGFARLKSRARIETKT